jgi:hypothetical protein
MVICQEWALRIPLLLLFNLLFLPFALKLLALELFINEGGLRLPLGLGTDRGLHYLLLLLLLLELWSGFHGRQFLWWFLSLLLLLLCGCLILTQILCDCRLRRFLLLFLVFRGVLLDLLLLGLLTLVVIVHLITLNVPDPVSLRLGNKSFGLLDAQK